MSTLVAKPPRPRVSVLIPTRNSADTLDQCLSSLKNQTYTNYELIIIDAFSTDGTMQIAKKFGAKIYTNVLKTAEAGKAIGLSKAKGQYIFLLDSDNMLPNPKYLSESIRILKQNPNCIGSEPWGFSYRKNAGYIERYCALFGVNDPYAWFANKLDKINYLTHKKWPHPNLVSKDNKKYIILKLKKHSAIPTIGANGTIFRTEFLRQNQVGNYLFDIDILNLATKKQTLYFIKLKQSIIHTYCESSVLKFIKKQSRRIHDYYQYQADRKTSWATELTSPINLFFVVYSFTILLPFATSLYGFSKKPDLAWFFHPLACFLTSSIYIKKSIYGK